MCSLSIQPIFDKKRVGENTIRSLEWKEAGHSHLRVFGNITHVHVSTEQSNKLDDKSLKYIFIGFDVNSKGYKLYNPNIRKTM